MSSRHERKVVLRSLTDEDREVIAGWHYPDELATYDPGRGAFDLHDPEHVALTASDGALLGYGTRGPEARVPGGAYGDGPDVLDIGLGLRPDLVGQGLGGHALSALMADARARLPITRFRATVATANPRATALVTRLGFTATHRFTRASDGRAFVEYELDIVRETDS